MRKVPRLAALLLLSFAMTAPAQAGWSLRENGETATVTKAKMTVIAAGDWNRWSSRPSNRGEIWTSDGLLLNELSFFAEIAGGETLYREYDKRNNPLPKFSANMLPTDIVELFEASSRIILQTSVFEMLDIQPAKFAGHDGVRFAYKYSAGDDQLVRRGEGVGAIIEGRLYLANYVAPEIYYFDKDLQNFRDMAASIKLAKDK
ncbi:hypothetical protein ACFOWX_05875 [Sphingorhabdus arenilitoris]|uniref:Uncharacterized protein n=1 Tax=Sphingorhabdus arenilitoris TaxID=1490041 RepID=A0ABV8RI17_9SPHN